MASFRELQDDTYFWLGTNEKNQAFPRDQIKRILNQCQDALHEECLRSYPDALTVSQTLTPDGTDDTMYVGASQSPALTSVALIVEVRLTDAQGPILTETPFSERYRRAGRTYSLTGFASPVFYVGANVTGGQPLYLAYAPGPTALSGDGDSPDWMPDRFHDILSLQAAKRAAGSGNEQSFSPLLNETLENREGQLRFAFGQRSLSPRLTRAS